MSETRAILKPEVRIQLDTAVLLLKNHVEIQPTFYNQKKIKEIIV